MKNDREIIAAAPKPITMGTFAEGARITVCMNCNATRKEITVMDSVIAPIISILDLFFLLTLYRASTIIFCYCCSSITATTFRKKYVPSHMNKPTTKFSIFVRYCAVAFSMSI